MGWWAYRLSGSVAWLAAVGVCSQLPILLFGPWAASVSDRIERRKGVMTTQALSLLQALALCILYASGQGQMWQVVALSLFLGVVNTFDIPIRQSYASHLVPAEDLKNSVAINALFSNMIRLIAPAVGGIVIAKWGEGYCFAANTLSFLGILFSLSRLKKQKAHEDNDMEIGVWTGFAQGAAHARKSHAIVAGLAMAFCISLFATPYLTLMPALAKSSFGAGAREFGFAMGASGVGAMLAGLVQAASPSMMRARSIPWLGALGGASLAAMASMPNIYWAMPWLALVGFGLAGAASTTSVLVQTNSAPNMRGRVLGMFSMCMYGGAPLGMLAFGMLAEHAGTRFSVAFGGALCAIGCAGLGFWMKAGALKRKAIRDARIAGGDMVKDEAIQTV